MLLQVSIAVLAAVLILFTAMAASTYVLDTVVFLSNFNFLMGPQFLFHLMTLQVYDSRNGFKNLPLLRKVTQVALVLSALLGIRAIFRMSSGIAADAHKLRVESLGVFRGELPALYDCYDSSCMPDSFGMLINRAIYWTIHSELSALHLPASGLPGFNVDFFGSCVHLAKLMALAYGAGAFAVGIVFALAKVMRNFLWIAAMALRAIWFLLCIPGRILMIADRILQNTFRFLVPVILTVLRPLWMLSSLLWIASTVGDMEIWDICALLLAATIVGVFVGTFHSSSSRYVPVPYGDTHTIRDSTKAKEETAVALFEMLDETIEDKEYIHALLRLSTGEIVLLQIIFAANSRQGAPDSTTPLAVYRNVFLEVERGFQASDRKSFSTVSGCVDTHVKQNGNAAGYTVKATVSAMVLSNFFMEP